MTDSAPSPTSPLPSSNQNADRAASGCATEGAAPSSAAPEDCFPLPPAHDLQTTKPTIRERAFDAAQRLVLSQPYMAIGQIEQNRVADYILQVAERFEAWMMAQPPLDLRTMDTCMSGWDASAPANAAPERAS